MEFLCQLAESAPEAVVDLNEAVWAPLYHPTFVKSALTLDENPELLAALKLWCRRWNLMDADGPAEWVVQAALVSMAGRSRHHIEGRTFPSNYWGLVSVSCEREGLTTNPLEFFQFPPADLCTFQPPACKWDVWSTGEPINKAKDRILAEVERHLDKHIAAYDSWAAGAWIEATAVERKWKAHLMYFVEFQVKGLTVAEISELHAIKKPTNKDVRLYDSTIRKALKSVAASTGLRSRQSARGRPKEGALR